MFKRTYLGETGQLTSQGNGVVSTKWGYYPNLQDRKLQSIVNAPNASAYQYSYAGAPEGDITGIDVSP